MREIPPTTSACGRAASPLVQINHRLQTHVASSTDEIRDAWRLVYRVYRALEYIPRNPTELHLSPWAIDAASAVLYQADHRGTVCTATAVVDDLDHLPLDVVYPGEMQSLRAGSGTRLMEVTMLADRGQLARAEAQKQSVGNKARRSFAMARTCQRIVEIMRYAFHFAVNFHGVTDTVVGVHPRHAPFYRRAFGFEPVAPARTHPAVNHRPVVLLRANYDRIMSLDPLPYALKHANDHPVDSAEFLRCYRFECHACTVACDIRSRLDLRAPQAARAG